VAEFMLKLISIYSACAAIKHGTIFLWNREREISQMECILWSRNTWLLSSSLLVNVKCKAY